MARTIQITWSAGRRVAARLAVPKVEAGTGILLAHGAGAGQDHPFMVAVRNGLAGLGHATMTFDYPFVAEGRRRPDRAEILLECHRAAADRLAARCDRVVLAGKSMGGRIGSHLAGDRGYPASSLVYLGYPLVPLGKGEPRDTSHLERITVPQLFFSGSRDRLSPPVLIEALVGGLPAGTLVVVPDADHSFHVPKRSGTTDAEVMDAMLQEIVAFVCR